VLSVDRAFLGHDLTRAVGPLFEFDDAIMTEYFRALQLGARRIGVGYAPRVRVRIVVVIQTADEVSLV
jgi:hypothetical protein